MKIMLGLVPCSPGLARRIAADAELAKGLGVRANAATEFVFPKFFDGAGPLLPRLLALADGEPLTFLREVQCSPAELESASHLEVVARVTIGQTDADRKATLAAYQSDHLHATASRWSVRLPRQVFLSKPVPPEAICHVDQWTGEYVVGHEVARSLQDSGFTGLQLQPLRRPKGEDESRPAWHLVGSQLLPAAVEDATVVETFDDGPQSPGIPRRHGLLCYAPAALDDSTDLARTAEPWGAWSTPGWVVRQRVRQWFVACGWRGWAFRPVLVEGTALAREHAQRWQELRGTLGEAGARVAI